MTKSARVVLLTTLIVGCVIGNALGSLQCRDVQGCSCLVTSDNTYLYQCHSFTALMKDNKTLEITCDKTEINSVQFGPLNIEKLVISKCPVSPFLISLDSLKTLAVRENTETLTNGIQLPQTLTEIEINFAKIQLKDGCFENNRNIQTLNLAHNLLKDLSRDVFKNLTKLVHLDLSYNEIEDLPNTVFYGLRLLRYLNLEMNKLTSISSNLFYDLQNLEEINLSNNKIASISDEAFQRLTNLKTVNISYNYIDFDEMSTFHSNLRLSKADLSHNRISRMANDLILNKVHLEDLDLSFNEISYIEHYNLQAVSQHAKINLAHNKIATVNFTYVDIILEEMNLAENMKLPQQYQIETIINLNNNPFICDCTLYAFILYLSKGISTMQFEVDSAYCASPQHLNGTPLAQLKLETLTCTVENHICPGTCQCYYRPWDNTIVVNCANKNLSMVPVLRIPSNNVQIEVHLEDNFLTNGPKEQMGYEHVTKLIMSRNKIRDVTWVPPNLQVLELDGNYLTTLNEEVLTQLNSENLTKILLGYNPWKCDCFSEHFSNFLIKQMSLKNVDISNIHCGDNNRLLIHVNSHEVCLPPGDSNTLLMVLVFSFVILLLFLFAIIFVVRKSKSRKKIGLKRSQLI